MRHSPLGWLSTFRPTRHALARPARPAVPAAVAAAALLAAASLVGCSRPQPAGGPGDAGRVRVMVGIAPVASLVERVGGPRVAVDMFVPAGQDPHTFAPTPKQAAALGRAKLLVTSGLPFEERLAERIGRQVAGLRIVDASQGVARRPFGAGEGHGCQATCQEHGHGHAVHAHGIDHHDHDSLDPHVWLSLPALRTMAADIAAALEEVDPDGRDLYRANLKQLENDLDAAHERIDNLLEPHRGRTIYVFHPALGYFADAYGLRQRAIEIEGKAPTARQLREVIAEAKADAARLLVVQPQFDQRSAAIVAEAIGCRLLDFDPLAEDVIGSLETLAERLAEELR
jgi:zinc transport system substrate-binding protein